MKNIVLAGLLYDENLGDQAIYYCTKAMVDELLQEKEVHYEIRSLDLYGRKQNDTIWNRLINKITGIITMQDHEARICRQVSLQSCRIIDNETVGLIFVGGGLLKYKHQILSSPIQVILRYCRERKIPVMLSAVGIEGFDDGNRSCKELASALNNKNIKIITTRDDLDLLRKKWIWNASILTEQVADPACGISKYIQPHLLWNYENVIGLGIGREGLFRDYEASISTQQIKLLWTSLYKELVKRGYRCVLFTNGLKADYLFAQEILGDLHQCGFKDAVCLKRPSNTPELVNMIASFSGEIVTRLHSSIIGFSYDVPSIGLIWNEKQAMFGKIIGYPERFLYPKDFNVIGIVDRLEEAIQEKHKKTSDKNERVIKTKQWIGKFIDIILEDKMV